MDDDVLLSFGRWVRRRRRSLDLTQDALAALVGCSKELIVKIEGDARRPSRATAALLADRLQLDPGLHETFVRCARAQLAPDHLPSPAAGMLSTRPSAVGIAAGDDVAGRVFLLTDIEAAPHLWEHSPDTRRRALARHEALLRQAVAKTGGQLFRSAGDTRSMSFRSPRAALQGALAIQRALRDEPWDRCGLPEALRVRMAVHVGASEPQDDGYVGPALSRAARLLASAHGGQVVLSAAAHELLIDQLPAGVSLRELGTFRLQDLSHPERISQLCAPDLPSEFPPLRTLDTQAGNLPLQLSELIGRADETAALLALLRGGARLVTLTGPGGIGKTRLALHVAAELAAAYADGAWFVDLAPITNPAQVPAAIAQTLSLPVVGGQPTLAALRAYLRGRHLLLLLDNVEQVAEAAPDIASLLTAAPAVVALVTSRAALHLAGEHEFPVPPLPAPPELVARDDRVAEELAQFDAVRLFVARAQAVRPDFQLAGASARAVASICARLGGLPLAIELAAARVRLFSPDALLLRLERDGGLGVLVGGPRDHPARQRTIRATLAWSEALLSPAERDLFYRLGVFAGGWALDGALAVGSATEEDGEEVLDHLEALVDHHLVALLEGSGDEPRYGMLELVRVYALERLRATGLEQDARRRHAAYVAGWAERLDASVADVSLLARIRRERANITAALAWSFDAGGRDAEYALRIMGGVYEYWFFFLHHEGRVWAHRTIAAAAQLEGAPATAAALNGAARLLWAAGDPMDIRPLLEHSLALARRDGDQTLEAEVLRHLGEHVLGLPGGHEEARCIIEASLAVGRACRSAHTELWSTVILGAIALRTGQLDTATEHFTHALERARAGRDAFAQMTILRYLTETAERQGRGADAERYLEQGVAQLQALDQGLGPVFAIDDAYLAYLRREHSACLALLEAAEQRAQTYGQTPLLLTIAAFAATVHLVCGDLPHAAAAARDALARYCERPRSPAVLARTATVAARIATMRRRFPEAAALLGCAAILDPVVAGFEDQPDPALEQWRDADAQACQTALGEAAFAAAWASGQGRALADAIDTALSTDS